MATPAKRRKRKGNDNPLWLHSGTGQWAKKFGGKMVYFGTDLQAALRQYDEERASWEAGINPREAVDTLGNDPTVRQVCNAYLASQDAKVQGGELSPRTFREQEGTCKAMVDHFGAQRRVSGLKPHDFAPLRSKLAERYGPNRLANEITRVRGVFKFAFENDYIEKPVRYGTQFKTPAKRTRRQHNNERKAELDPLTPSELRAIIAAASIPMKAAVLLGINCGFGSADIGTLKQSGLNISDGWVNHPRAKTAVPRRAALWPETVAAIQAATAVRPSPSLDGYSDLVLLTTFGRPWYRVSDTYEDADGKLKGGVPTDAIAQEWGKLLRTLKLNRKGIGFYHLRHLFQTVGEETHDTPAVDSLMGHVDDSMADPYRINIKDERLRLVTDHIHEWLYADASTDDEGDDQPDVIPFPSAAG